ncbi:MAG: inorganic phosphate transporter [Candidatus Glassbacteria bacterium]|nr:inorganic phosphate transporter [Candidatus Glassbacteria bacterium]
MFAIGFLVLAVFFLAWSNGANDNFKGVATLYGSGTCSFRRALILATVATVLGSLVSVMFAQYLIKTFSGHGLIPNRLIDSRLMLAVGFSGVVTILSATLLGMPTSTTHALTGALVGAALVADSGSINWRVLAGKFGQPLLLSPLLAIGITVLLYPFLRMMRETLGVEREQCVCIGSAASQPVEVCHNGSVALKGSSADILTMEMGSKVKCMERYRGRMVGLDAQTLVNALHYLSGSAVCFARAVNDTPKIAALLLAGGAITATRGGEIGSLALIALAMAAGGLIHARKVAETMSKRITELNSGQGLTANLVASALILGASRLGLPVSTTHVSCGSIFAIGLVNRHRQWSTITQIAVTWITTLPLGLGLGAAFYWVLV